MFRYGLLFTLAMLPGCAQPPQPTPHVDGEVIERAVQHAQAQADRGSHREAWK